MARAEADFLATRLPAGIRLDLGCGHGRHLTRLQPGTIGLDFDPLSLAQAKAAGPVVRGDFQALPLRSESLDGAYCWYNSLGTLDSEALKRALQELFRVLRPGGTLILQGTNPRVAQANPEAHFSGHLPDGAFLEEVTRWSFVKERDELHRRLTLPDGRIMAASFFIRYYAPEAWRAMLEARGFAVAWVVGGVDGGPVTDASSDVIVGAHKRE
jgi:SAM-dependent methyltransferase